MMVNKEVLLGSDPWSQSFIQLVKKPSYQSTLALWKENPDIDVKDTPYYQHYMDVLAKNGTVWDGILKNEEDVKRQTENFRTMFRIAPNWEPKKVTCQKVEDHYHYYGPCPIHIGNNGDFSLYDGHHRINILLFMNKPVTLTICERAPEWQKMMDDLGRMYGGEKLYQPIPHPDFDSWECSRDCSLDDAIYGIIKDRQVKSVLDLGSCHGYTLYKLKDLLDSGMAVENNPLRHQVVKLLMSKLDFRCSNLNITSYMKHTCEKCGHEIDMPYDCILALAVLHHIMRLDSKSNFDNLLKKIGTKTLFIYTLPEPNEPQYEWMHEYQDHHNYIQKLTGFQNKQIIQLKSRKLIVLWKND